jgi:hypothetical protein
MRDPFGMQQSRIVLSSGDKNSVTKKDKKNDIDLVKIYLASVPALESAKEELENISQSVQDEAVKNKVNGFVKSIITITEEILDLTKIAIRQERNADSATESVADPRQVITPEMINGTMPVR